MQARAFTEASPRKFALIALILLPAFVVYAILYREMVAIPLLDDYHAIFAFLLHLQRLPSFADKLIYIVAAQHTDYKLIFEHLIVAMQFSLMHRISLGVLIVLGNLFLLGLLAIYWKQYFTNENDLVRRLILFLPISYLIFQLNFAETVDWAMAGLQNLPVIVFSLASISFLVLPGKKAFGLACLSAAMASLSSANGFLLGPLGLLILLQHKKYRKLLPWCITFAIVLAMYLYRYVGADRVSTASVYLKTRFFLSFLGGGIENMHHFPIKNASTVLGCVILFIVGHAVRTRYYRDNPFAFFSCTWILLTAALVASVRSSFGLEQSLSGRYKIYCDLLLIFCYGYIVHRFTSVPALPRRVKRAYVLALVSVLAFSAASDLVGYKFLERRRARLEEGIKTYRANPSRNSPMLSPDDRPIEDLGGLPENARVLMNQAIERSIYTLPPSRSSQ